jgi:stalled ribosome alternative rescue factor ArfA
MGKESHAAGSGADGRVRGRVLCNTGCPLFRARLWKRRGTGSDMRGGKRKIGAVTSL